METAIITGVSGGIGRDIARLFAKEGHNVTVNYFSSPDRAENTVKLGKSLGVQAFAFEADVSNPGQVSLMVKQTVEGFNGIDGLVNNTAKPTPPMFDFDKPDWELWKRMVHVNLRGIVVCFHFAVQHLEKTSGNIVNVVMDYDPGGSGHILTKTTGHH